MLSLLLFVKSQATVTVAGRLCVVYRLHCVCCLHLYIWVMGWLPSRRSKARGPGKIGSRTPIVTGILWRTAVKCCVDRPTPGKTLLSLSLPLTLSVFLSLWHSCFPLLSLSVSLSDSLSPSLQLYLALSLTLSLSLSLYLSFPPTPPSHTFFLPFFLPLSLFLCMCFCSGPTLVSIFSVVEMAIS